MIPGIHDRVAPSPKRIVNGRCHPPDLVVYNVAWETVVIEGRRSYLEEGVNLSGVTVTWIVLVELKWEGHANSEM